MADVVQTNVNPGNVAMPSTKYSDPIVHKVMEKLHMVGTAQLPMPVFLIDNTMSEHLPFIVIL